MKMLSMIAFLLAVACGIEPVLAQSHPADASTILRQNVIDSATGETAREIVLLGVTAYDSDQLLNFAIAHERAVSNVSTATAVAAAISLIYREDGYFLAEAQPFFDPLSRTLTITVSEGSITDLQIEGMKGKVAAQINAYLSPLIGLSPLKIEHFERALMLSTDLSGVDLRSRFDDTSGGGKILVISGRQWDNGGAIMVDNIPLRPDFAVRAVGSAEHYSVLRGGDVVRATLVGTAEPDNSYGLGGAFFYRSPVGNDGAFIELIAGTAFSRRNNVVVTTDSEQRGYQAAVAVGYPFHRSVNGFGYVFGEYEYLDGRSLFGTSRSRSRSHSVRSHLIFGRSDGSGRVVEGSVTLSVGQRPDQPTIAVRDGAKKFAHARATFGVIEPAGESSFIRFETTAQYASAALPGVEKFFVGHLPSMRGYTIGEGEGDRGIAATLQLDHQIGLSGNALKAVTPILFFDLAHVGLKRPLPNQNRHDTLASLGAGFRTNWERGWSTISWVAIPLIDGIQSRSGHPALYLRLSKGW